MHLKKYLLVFFFSLFLFPIQGQISMNSDSLLKVKRPDSLFSISKKPFKASAFIFGTNMGVWSFDRYAINGPYAHINFSTIKQNIKTGFVWDNDMFVTNLFAHPYHGGLYFNAARSNGMNFWQSIPFAAGGSLMWEFCMENEPPAINDFMATTIGGTCLGELTFRISDRFIDDRAVGFDRFRREALLTLISPIRGLNRILSGDAWRHRNVKGNSIFRAPIVFYSTIGYRLITDNTHNKNDVSHMACYDLGLYYGNPYDLDNEKPYDFFSLKMSGNFLSQQPVISRFSAIGLLYARNIKLKRHSRQLTFGVFQHFNFYQTNTDINNVSLNPFKISEAASVGPGLLFKNRLTNKFTFSGSAHLSAILLGASQADYFKYEKRDYNMGSGFSSKLNFDFDFHDKVRLMLNSEDYRIYSWVGNNPANNLPVNSNVQGDVGHSSLSVVMLSLSYRPSKHLILGAQTGYFYRRSVYKYYTNINHSVTDHKLSIGYIL